MLMFGSVVLVAAAGLLAVPVLVFATEIFAALFARRGGSTPPEYLTPRPRVAVLVPAHNEGAGLVPTLSDVMIQLLPGDRILVVADNCTDETATIAAAAGAEVVERCDPARRGKGYALDYGVRHLASDPPSVLVVVDADCRLGTDAIARLARICAATQSPAQAEYVMRPPLNATVNYRVAEFAWRVKNTLRPSGLAVLGLPCQLMGTGMAFPWGAIRSANLAHGHIVEDLKLGLELATAGYPPLFCPTACVRSQFPHSTEGARHQRERWEHGHIDVILRAVPRLLGAAVRRRNWPLLVLTLDAAVPPLSLLVLLMVGMVLFSALASLAGISVVALSISLLSFGVLSAAVLLAWWTCGSDVLPARALPSILAYVVRKFGSYCRALSGRSAMPWLRTERREGDKL